MDKVRINLYDLLACISNAQDLVSTKLSNHQQQVAYLAFRLSESLNLPIEQQHEVFLASLIHDTGALSTKEKLELIETEPVNANDHALRGAKLFEGFKPLQSSAGIIKYHHIPWNDGDGNTYMGEEVPLASHIIHLADRTCALINPDRNIITQVPDILSKIRQQANSVFRSDLVDVLFDISIMDYIWLDLISPNPAKKVPNTGLFNTLTLEIDDIVDLALIFSRIIDFRSCFTARHSAGVAKTAEKLAQLIGFSPYECKMMLIAGYLHDLGKIALSDDVLEKPTKLNEDEFNEMRTHTFYTFHALEPIKQLRTINTWASFHHEKLDGKGYPFHIAGDSLSIGSRIMAVADVFTAVTENRPYRKGMIFDDAEKVLRNMVASNALDGRIVNLLIENYQELDNMREISQIEAAEQYENFLRIG
ncbi:MAG: HD domain-containing protein [Eubacteriales bacterium]|nr:HD domain-containing protein [Eubacteriales bacterium]MDD3198826.1 HD domain-containing protein [Eubacteriales bacterium]MDD4121998.1 HD domain-containing protein [Eubacteriales bacterium]MDD4629777.1 HD domain-containing protein [Eubacteriales bacterium]